MIILPATSQKPLKRYLLLFCGSAHLQRRPTLTQLFRTFRNYWQLAISDLFSVYATSVAETTIQLWLLNSLLVGFADSSRYLTIYLTISSISTLVTGLFSGAIGERAGVLRTIIFACSTRIIAGLLIIATIYISGNFSIVSANISFWILTALVVITTGSDTFYSPAVTSFINKVTDPDKLIDVLSLMRLISLLGTLIGPAIAGFAGSSNAYIPILFTESISLVIAIMLVVLVSKKHAEFELTTSGSYETASTNDSSPQDPDASPLVTFCTNGSTGSRPSLIPLRIVYSSRSHSSRRSHPQQSVSPLSCSSQTCSTIPQVTAGA